MRNATKTKSAKSSKAASKTSARRVTSKAAQTRTRAPKGEGSLARLLADIREEFAPNEVIRIIGDNPKRPGQLPHQQFELMRKNRTVGKFLEAGGKVRWIRGAIRVGYAKVGRK